MHLFDAAVAFEAPTAFCVRFGERLVDAISRRSRFRIAWSLAWNGKGRAESVIYVARFSRGEERDTGNADC